MNSELTRERRKWHNISVYETGRPPTFWYVLMCLWFGAGYFAKVWAKKALWEVVVMVQSAPGEYAEAIIRALSGPAAPRRPGY